MQFLVCLDSAALRFLFFTIFFIFRVCGDMQLDSHTFAAPMHLKRRGKWREWYFGNCATKGRRWHETAFYTFGDLQIEKFFTLFHGKFSLPRGLIQPRLKPQSWWTFPHNEVLLYGFLQFLLLLRFLNHNEIIQFAKYKVKLILQSSERRSDTVEKWSNVW